MFHLNARLQATTRRIQRNSNSSFECRSVGGAGHQRHHLRLRADVRPFVGREADYREGNRTQGHEHAAGQAQCFI